MRVAYVRDWLARHPNPYKGRRAEMESTQKKADRLAPQERKQSDPKLRQRSASAERRRIRAFHHEQLLSVKGIATALGRPRGFVERAVQQGMAALGGRMSLTYVLDWLMRNPNPYTGRHVEVKLKQQRIGQ